MLSGTLVFVLAAVFSGYSCRPGERDLVATKVCGSERDWRSRDAVACSS